MKQDRNTRKVNSLIAQLGKPAGPTLFAGLLVLAFGTCSAQQDAATTPALQKNPELALREFEPAVDQPYELGRGDEISIDFNGRSEMNSKQVIGPDGKITLPLAGSIQVADLTREQAADVITTELKPYYTSVGVTVGVDRYTSDQVLLLGAVEHPGVQTFDRPPTLLEVISKGGAIEGSHVSRPDSGSYAMGASLQPAGYGVPERCAIYRGSNQVVWVDLKKLLDSGNALADLRLKRDDIVYVPSASERYISVLGQVMHPGALQLDDSSTLPKLLSLAGGITNDAGRYPLIQIVSPSTGKTRTISFKQVLQPESLDLTLHSGDIIYVPQSGFARMGYAIEKLSPLVTMFTASALITSK